MMEDWTVVKKNKLRNRNHSKITWHINLLEVETEASSIPPTIVQDTSIVVRIGEYIKQCDNAKLLKDDSYCPLLDLDRFERYLHHDSRYSCGLEIARKETIKPSFFHSTLDILHAALGNRYDYYLSQTDFVTSRGALLNLMRLFEHPDSPHLTDFELQLSRKKIHPTGSKTVLHLSHGGCHLSFRGDSLAAKSGSSFTQDFREALTRRHDPSKTLGRVGQLHLPLTREHGCVSVLVTYEVDAVDAQSGQEALLRTYDAQRRRAAFRHDYFYSLAVSDTHQVVIGAYQHDEGGTGQSKAHVTGIEVVDLTNVLPANHEARHCRMAQLAVLLAHIRAVFKKEGAGCTQATVRFHGDARHRHTLRMTLFPSAN